ncbi:hypothetical protein GCM10007304_40290 [Rhodococcoides trifolii]|uniref:DUF2537 domain-containing protein n=1 Tax=Rhodococcoides trifolii TaxID=908250 RepID=A0A917LGI8_9NOCA|nr:DUF2537 domain-containing protein [Rhodococcus trifolii]GGG22426.1 hypothetical protein GCM10007304_40290 [Rhodococcus trifolii]
MTDSEDTPWFAGMFCAALAAVLVGALIMSMGLVLSMISVVFAVIVLVVVIAGAAPTLMRYRRRPVWRWVIPGATVGAAVGVVVVLADVL